MTTAGIRFLNKTVLLFLVAALAASSTAWAEEKKKGDDKSVDDEAARLLAERERALARRVRDAAALLDDFGRTVAWPEAMARLEEDLLTCGDLLDRADFEPARALQRDIEDMLETLMQVLSAAPEPAERPPDQERQDRERRQRERPPVNMAEELKVLRTLQSALNRRTARLDERRGVLESPELGSGVERLAERQAALREGLLELEQLTAGGEAE